MKQEFFTGAAPHITITECHGQLVVRGRPENRIVLSGGSPDIKSDGETDNLKGKINELTLSSHGSLTISVPVKSSVTITHAHGSVVLKAVEGTLTASHIQGDLLLKTAGSAKISQLKGNLAAKNMNGPLHIEQAQGDIGVRNIQALHLAKVVGDVSARNVEGDATIDHCSGDISLRSIGGGVNVHYAARDVNLNNIAGIVAVDGVGGDIRLRDGLISGKHTLKAARDIVIRWPVQAPLLLDAKAREITCKLPLNNRTEEAGMLTGQIGDGEARVTLESKRDIIIKPLSSSEFSSSGNNETSFEFQFDLGEEMTAFGNHLSGLGEQIASEVTNRMTELSSHLENQFKAMRKREEAVRRAKNRAAAYGSPPPPPPPQPAAPPPAPTPPRSGAKQNAAQLKILEMLEQGKISVEDAQTLLKALE